MSSFASVLSAVLAAVQAPFAPDSDPLVGVERFRVASDELSTAAVALNYISRQAGQLGSTPRHGLALRHAPIPDATGAVLFQRTIDGLPVFNGAAAVAIDSRSGAEGVEGSRLPIEISGRFALGDRAASAVALGAAPAASVLKTELGWWSIGRQARAAYRVHLASRTGALEVLVDADDGRVLFARDRRSHATGRIYELSPVELPGGLVCDPDTFLPYQLCASTVLRPLGHLNGSSTLVGSRVTVYNCRGRNAPMLPGDMGDCELVTSSDGDSFDFREDPTGTVASDDFAAVNLYYHIDQHQDFLGGLDASTASRLPHVVAFVNAYDRGHPLNNAYFDPEAGALVFGQSSLLDFAYDASIIFHEYDHSAILAFGDFLPMADTLGTLLDPAALAEGVADAFAAAHSGNSRIGLYAGAAFGTPPPPYLRDLSTFKTCGGSGTRRPWFGQAFSQDGLDGDPHNDGEIWGGFFWDLHTGLQTITPEAAARIQFRAMQLAGGTSPTFASFWRTMKTAAEQLYPQRPEVALFIQCLAARRELDGCDRSFALYAGEQKGLLVQHRYSSFQYSVHLPAGTSTLGACSVLGRPFDLYYRANAPVQLRNPALTGTTTIDSAHPETQGPIAVDARCNAVTPFTISVSEPTIVFVLVDAPAAVVPAFDFVLLNGPDSGPSRPPSATPGSCSLGSGPVPIAQSAPQNEIEAPHGCSQGGVAPAAAALVPLSLFCCRRKRRRIRERSHR